MSYRKNEKRKASWQNKVRINKIKSGGLSEMAKMIISYHHSKCKESGRKFAAFSIQAIPLSLNHQYDEIIHRFKVRRKDGTSTVIHKPAKKLKDEVKAWRDLVNISAGHHKGTFRPTGPIAVVILFQSTKWVTKEFKVRQTDTDNYIKPLLDAIENPLESPDELVWDLHTFKVLGPKDRTIVYVFDLGDVVDYHDF